jgi:DNA polymerase III subunit delta'
VPFSDVLGHARPMGLLARSIARGSLPPSLLFTGPEGVGKKLVARAVAGALNCLSPREGDACGTCAACRRIEKGTHPDVITIEPEDSGSIKIDQVRPAIAATAYRPFEGRHRVVIVDEADRLGVEAENSLLKSLEEPPPASVFILVTSRPEMLLPTIRSRCSQLRFGRLSAGEVARFLTDRHGVADDEAHAIAAVADGSPGRALEAGSKAYRDARASALAALQAVAAATSPKVRLQAATGLTAGKPSSATERDALAARIAMLASLLRDLAVLSQGGSVAQLANGDLAGALGQVSAAFGSERALKGFAAADRAVAALRRNASPKIVAAWLAVHL